jgi:hypothetical protein
MKDLLIFFYSRQVKKQSLMRVLQNAPCIPQNDSSEAGPSTAIQKICTYGQCNGHSSKVEPSASTSAMSGSKICYICSKNTMGELAFIRPYLAFFTIFSMFFNIFQ